MHIFNQIIYNVGPNWVGLQESKLRKVSDLTMGQLFRNHNVGYAYSSVIDSTRGIIRCWNYASFVKSARFCQSRFVTIRGSWVVGTGSKGLICMYDPNDFYERVAFFENTISFVHIWDCKNFISLRDFNSIMQARSDGE